MKKKYPIYVSQIFFFLFSYTMTAQSEIFITPKNSIIAKSDDAQSAALLLKKYLDKTFPKPFDNISENIKDDDLSSIILEISDQEKLKENEFVIKSDSKSVYLIAQNPKYLRYAVYTLL